MRCHLGVLSLVVLLAVAFRSVRAIRRAKTRAESVPLSPLTARWRVGADYPERRGIVGDGEVVGEMDDMDAYARPDFDPDALDSEVRRFYEQTSEYELRYSVEWHRPFRLGAALASKLTSRLEQLNLPAPGDTSEKRLSSRFEPVDSAADFRDGARAWVRTRPDGEAVFVAIYASHTSEGESDDETRYVNIAAPLPWSNLSTVLRPETMAESGGIELTTRSGSEGGLYLVTPLGAISLPLDQRFRVRSASASALADALVGGVAETDFDIVADHEMWLCGMKFLTVRYTGARSEPSV